MTMTMTLTGRHCRYSTPRGSFADLSEGNGSTTHVNAPVNENTDGRTSGGFSNYGFYNGSETRERPTRYLSPANSSRQRDRIMYVGQNRGRRTLNSRYEQSYGTTERRGGRARRASDEPRREESWAYIDNAYPGDLEVIMFFSWDNCSVFAP